MLLRRGLIGHMVSHIVMLSLGPSWNWMSTSSIPKHFKILKMLHYLHMLITCKSCVIHVDNLGKMFLFIVSPQIHVHVDILSVFFVEVWCVIHRIYANVQYIMRVYLAFDCSCRQSDVSINSDFLGTKKSSLISIEYECVAVISMIKTQREHPTPMANNLHHDQLDLERSHGQWLVWK